MRAWAVASLAVAAALVVPQGAHAFVPLGEAFRISFTGPDSNANYDASSSRVAYNPTAGEYLVVWEGNEGEFEIFAQRLSVGGAPLGGRIRVSVQGANGDPLSEAHSPSVAYNPAEQEYLVVWEGEIGSTSEFEIWGRRLSATGERLGGSDDLQISDMGPGGDAGYSAFNPNVVYNPAGGEYLVVWEGDDDTEYTLGAPLVNDEFEIFGQRMTGAGVEVGGDFRVSEQGADGVAATDATTPSLAYNPTANEYLVAWTGEDGVSDEDEIWAQRLSTTGGEAGGSDFAVSDMGPPGNASYNASRPSVAANPATGDYLVVWDGDDDTGPLVDGEFEVYSQRLTATGTQTGVNDFRISETGTDGNLNGATAASVAATANEYVVVWRGDDMLAANEIYGERLPATGVDAVQDDVRISHGTDRNFFYEARTPSVAANPSAKEYLAVWSCSDNTPPLAPGKFEIFGRRLGDPPPAGGGATSGGGTPTGGGAGARPAFGARTLVTLALAARRIPASGPLKIRVTNQNDFAVTGRLSGRTIRPVSGARKRRIALKARSFSVDSGAGRTVKLRLPRALRRLLKRSGKLSLRLTANVNDPAGNRRDVTKKLTPRLRPKRRR